MTLSRSLAARPDETRGTTAQEVRQGLAGLFTQPGVLPGHASPLVRGSSSYRYALMEGTFVTRRAAGDGVHLFSNDGALYVDTDPSPASGLSRIDVVYVMHPSAGENGDTSSDPILGVAIGTPASSPIAPALPTGALEVGRNTMTSAATSTASGGNTISQTAAVAALVTPPPPPPPVVALHRSPDSGFPTDTTTTTTPRVHNRITVPAVSYPRVLVVTATCHLTYSQDGVIEALLHVGDAVIDQIRPTVAQDALTPISLAGQWALPASQQAVVEVRFNRVTGPGVVTPSTSSLTRINISAHPVST